MNSSVPAPPSPHDPAVRLSALLATRNFIPFLVDVPDKDFPFIRLSIYGAIETNELFVKLTNDKVAFVEVVDSPLLNPRMGERISGTNSEDSNVSFALANQIWDDHQNALLQR